jgi:hypothetical protein
MKNDYKFAIEINKINKMDNKQNKVNKENKQNKQNKENKENSKYYKQLIISASFTEGALSTIIYPSKCVS